MRFTATATVSFCCCDLYHNIMVGPWLSSTLTGSAQRKSAVEYLEDSRLNTVSTCNVRLAAIHTFFRYAAQSHPDHFEQCQHVLAIPFKRFAPQPIEYLEYEEIQAVPNTVDRSTVDGCRNYALLATFVQYRSACSRNCRHSSHGSSVGKAFSCPPARQRPKRAGLFSLVRNSGQRIYEGTVLLDVLVDRQGPGSPGQAGSQQQTSRAGQQRLV